MNNQTAGRHWRAVELDKVLRMLAEETACEDAAVLAREITPSSSLEEVRRMLAETDDAYVMMARFGAPSFGGLKNVTNALRRAEAGGTLNLTELLRIGGVLRTIRGITQWRSKSEGMKTALDWRFEGLSPNKYLEDRIGGVVLSEEEVADTASTELASIRRKIRGASSRVREQLDKMIRSPAYQKYLQDPIVTQRSGRYVVPVKAEYRGEIPGLVHDTSASGATVFVEPMGVVEANNEIRVLLSREQAEIERILLELSGEVGSFADSIVQSYQIAVELNVIFAKGSLAYKMKASLPQVNDQGRISLKKARHPLIDKEKVVPTDITLGETFDTLVITGPNTGGKTVSLKTIGLLSLMAMCGLMLPVADESEISVFDQVLVDIGDEQSIEQSLSTFSAHMTNIIRIIAQADNRSLVLLDELSSGTDPVEGAALAISILEALREKGVRMAATTHYAELKAYALQTPGVENGCCEFDVATLRPTYRLLIGVPGRSNAFAISLRLGMAPEIVDRARGLVSEENSQFENVVENLETSRQKLEFERKKLDQLRREAAQAKKEAEEQRRKVEEESSRELDRARQQASQLVARTRAQIDAMLTEMEELRRQQNKALSAEQKARLRSGMRRLEDTADPIHGRKKDEGYVLPRPLQVGDTVLIFDIDKKATVLELPKDGDQVLVQAGIIKTRVPMSNLRLVKEPPKEAAPGPNRRQRRVTRSVARGAQGQETPAGRSINEVDLRGQTTEEALMTLDQYIDHALLTGVHQITIIHGKGTGALRKAVQEHLRHHPSIGSFRLGVFGEGESGVTIAELK